MQPAPLPPNEQERLAHLRRLNILDTEAEAAFDRVTRVAAQVLDVPIVLVSLVDEERQWFKSRVGLEATQTPRDVAFCAHAILEDSVFVVPDAHVDERFRDNPLVTGAPEVRFYAGAPLTISAGVRVGTLCAIDHKPRKMTPEQEQALADLADVVVDAFRLRLHIRDLEEASQITRQRTIELNRANAAQEQFAHIAAHDLRGPVKTMINFADVALLEANETQRPMIEFIREAAADMESVVVGYRRLSQLHCAPPERATLTELVEAAQTRVPHAPAASVQACSVMECDVALMTQVFTNLIENAAKYGTGTPLEIASSCDGKWVSIEVRNEVEADVNVDQTVFAPFRRLTPAGEGVGLGLAIVERVVALHGGKVAATCEGRIFTIEMKLPFMGAA